MKAERMHGREFDSNKMIAKIRFLATQYPDVKLIVSSHPDGCPNGQSKIYFRLRKGRSGGLPISECMPNSKLEKCKKTMRQPN